MFAMFSCLQWPETLDDSPDSLKDFQLKEKLYLDAIEFLDKGKVLIC